MLIKLSDGCFIAADQIAEVRINSRADSIVIRTKDGIGHSHAAPYKTSLYSELDRLVTEINNATEVIR